MTPKLLALAKVCSVLGNIRDVSWHLSKRGNELEKRGTFSFLDRKWGVHKNEAFLIIIFWLPGCLRLGGVPRQVIISTY